MSIRIKLFLTVVAVVAMAGLRPVGAAEEKWTGKVTMLPAR